MKKRNLIASAAILSIALLTACGASEKTGNTDTAAQADAASETNADQNNPDSDTKDPDEQTDQTDTEGNAEQSDAKGPVTTDKNFVALVTNAGGIEDQGFNQSAWEGLQWLSGKTDCKTDFLESRSPDQVEQNLEKAVENGAGLIWSIGYDSGDAILAVAEKYPDISFAIIDNSFEQTPDNVTDVVFRGEEPSFLVGYIAAMVTKTGKVGFVGGSSNQVIEAFEYGFKAGVDYGAAQKGSPVETVCEYAHSYTDREEGHDIAKRLYQDGCDIVYHAAGETGIGVINAAVEADKFVIGVDKDQAYLAPANVLTSAMKYVNSAVTQVSESYLSGEKIGGKTISLGLSEDSVGISENHEHYSDEIYDAAMELAEKITDGELKVPSNAAEYGQGDEKAQASEESDAEDQGSYTDEEICKLCLDHYEKASGYRPAQALIDSENGDEIVIQLYDDMGDHTGTADWYTINRKTGKGTNFMGESISVW